MQGNHSRLPGDASEVKNRSRAMLSCWMSRVRQSTCEKCTVGAQKIRCVGSGAWDHLVEGDQEEHPPHCLYHHISTRGVGKTRKFGGTGCISKSNFLRQRWKEQHVTYDIRKSVRIATGTVCGEFETTAVIWLFGRNSSGGDAG